jgi:hypothetical protein
MLGTRLEQNRNMFGTEQEHFWNRTGTFLEQNMKVPEKKLALEKDRLEKSRREKARRSIFS